MARFTAEEYRLLILLSLTLKSHMFKESVLFLERKWNPKAEV